MVHIFSSSSDFLSRFMFAMNIVPLTNLPESVTCHATLCRMCVKWAADFGNVNVYLYNPCVKQSINYYKLYTLIP